MPENVDELRRQLRERGYLSHGIERWFALDPWSSRTFWTELAVVALRVAVVLAFFGALPPMVIMTIRNHPLGAGEVVMLLLLYGVTAAAAAFTLTVFVALLLKLRPEIAVDTPRALLAISFLCAGLLTSPLAVFWYGFDALPSAPELLTGLVLAVAYFLVASIAISAALLSFSIYELQRIPAIHQHPRGAAMTTAALIVLALFFAPSLAVHDTPAAEPLQVVTAPASRRVALVAVDGLTLEILRSRGALLRAFATAEAAAPVPGNSTAERWATVGTGVPARLHGVRAIAGVRLAGGTHILQSLSRADFVLQRVAPAVRLAVLEPLPPTIRRRAYVWEIFAARGTPVVAVNWWTSDDVTSGGLRSVSPMSVFAEAGRNAHDAARAAIAVDTIAGRRLLGAIDASHPAFATVYLPSLDVILNRAGADQTTQLARSLEALELTGSLVSALRTRGYDVVLVGAPGDRQSGAAVVAATFPLIDRPASLLDVAPTTCTLVGFPASDEMAGQPLVGGALPRITSYGVRGSNAAGGRVTDEYYRNLKSLGYVR